MACSAASTSKRQKHSYPDMDRISNLPDSLLCHILSFLPTKKVVATSNLSSRWKTLWTLVPKLDFDSRELETKSSDGEQSHNQYHFNFAHIVSRVWALRNANPIQKFRLHWDDNFDHIHVDTWVRAAIARGVKDLELEVNIRFGSFPPLYFPCSVFNGNTLVILKLGSFIVLESSPGSSFVFPSLQILHLRITNVDSDSHHDSLSRLHAFCPVLQELFVAIYECRFELDINVPALEYLRFEGNLGDVSLENLPNSVKPVLDLNSVGLDYVSEHGNSVWDLLGQLCNVESLHLYSETVEVKDFMIKFLWFSIQKKILFL
jgi:hypothetical protein